MVPAANAQRPMGSIQRAGRFDGGLENIAADAKLLILQGTRQGFLFGTTNNVLIRLPKGVWAWAVSVDGEDIAILPFDCCSGYLPAAAHRQLPGS